MIEIAELQINRCQKNNNNTLYLSEMITHLIFTGIYFIYNLICWLSSLIINIKAIICVVENYSVYNDVEVEQFFQ